MLLRTCACVLMLVCVHVCVRMRPTAFVCVFQCQYSNYRRRKNRFHINTDLFSKTLEYFALQLTIVCLQQHEREIENSNHCRHLHKNRELTLYGMGISLGFKTINYALSELILHTIPSQQTDNHT